LVDDGLVVRYHIDEAASGQAPTELADAAAEPLPLTLAYTPDMSFVEVEGHRGLRYESPGGDGRAYTLVDATKIQEALAGSTKITFELVIHIEGATLDHSRLIHLGAMTDHGNLSLQIDALSNLHLHFETDLITWIVPYTLYGRSVLHVVVDSADADPVARARCYLNASPCALVTGTPATENAAITVDAGKFFEVGNREAVQRSIRGVIFYAAVYAAALSEAQVLHNTALLHANDDTP
jgi:hypothetical protein